MLEDKKWWKEAVGYQIYIRSFFDSNGDGVGDLNGISEKLDYIKSLGADFIWIVPFYDSPLDDNGYDIRDYRKILSEYGTMKDFEKLVKFAHDKEIKVVIDLVLNHTSDENDWFIKSCARATGYEDFYYWKDGIENKDGTVSPPNNWESFFGGSAWKFDSRRKQFFLKIFSNKMPDVNYDCPKAVEEMSSVIEFWAKCGVDGFRVDAISHIGKDEKFSNGKSDKTYKKFSNLESGHKHLQKFAGVFNEYGLMTMGELGGDPTFADKLKYSGCESNELNMVFSFEHLNNAKKDKNGDRVVLYSKIVEALRDKQRLAQKGGWPVLFWTNHDYRRVASMYGDERALAKSCSALACAMYLLAGTPVVYNGEEIGMTNYPFRNENELLDVDAKTRLLLAKEDEKQKLFEEIRQTTRDNARTIMQWSGGVNAGFTDAKPCFVVNGNYHYINVENEQKDEHSVLNEYKKIIGLRKSNSDAFVYSKIKWQKAEKGIVHYKRFSSSAEFDVIVNLSDCVKKFIFPVGEIIYSNYGEVIRGEISPYEAVVIKKTLCGSAVR